MKTFKVTTKTTVEIEAENHVEARKLFKEKYPDHRTDTFYTEDDSEFHEVVGVCEDTGLPIFSDEVYCSDSEGIMWFAEKTKKHLGLG